MTARPDKSERRYEDIFNNAATAILEEDISGVWNAINWLKAQGISDFKKYLDENPDFVQRAAQTVKILDANDAALKLYKARSKSELLTSIDKVFTQKSYDIFKQEMTAMAEGKRYFEAEDININLQGEPVNILVHAALPSEDSEFTNRLTSITDITERKRMEKALQESEKNYHDLIDNSKDAIFRVRTDKSISFASPACRDIFGYSPKEFIEDSGLVVKILHPDSHQQFNDFWEQYSANGIFPTGMNEWALVRKDGQTVYTENNFSNLYDTHGNIIGFQTIARDITKRKKAEKYLDLQYNIIRILAELGEVSDTMQKVLQTACKDIGCEIGEIWFVDNKTNTLRLCSSWHKPELEGSEFIEKSKEFTFQKGKGLPGRVWESGQPAWITDVTTDENFPRLSIAFKTGLHGAFAFPIKSSGKVTGVMNFCFRDIKPSDNDLLLMLDALGNQIGSFIERRRIEERLHRYESIVSSSNDHMSLIDRNYVYQSVNKAYLEAFNNKRRNEIEGHSVAELFGTETFEKTVKNYLDRCLNGEIINYQSWFDFPGLGQRFMDVCYYPFYGVEGSVSGVVVISRDITENRKMEEELEKTHKLKSIGILAGGIAHDFNNILTAILGNISLTKMHMSPDNKDFKRMTDAENACMQATELTSRLITFSKGGDPFRKALSIAGIVNEIACSALSNTDIACECNLPGDLLPVYADEGQIRHCFTNMVLNARDAMPDGGVVSFTAGNIILGEGEITGLKKGNYVKVSIRDSGKGIPEEILPMIFDPYFTTKEMGVQKGLGLGLSVCYSIVKKHEGHITVESKIGAGTTFHIYLPAVEPEIKAPVAAKTRLPGRKRILIMDDEAFVRDVAGQILEHLGYEVEYAGDGNEAIEACKRAKEIGKQFDAVILDLTIKGGMGGDMAIIRLLAIDPEIKAIVSSGYADNPVMTDYKKYGFVGAIPKPYNVEQLKEMLNKVTG